MPIQPPFAAVLAAGRARRFGGGKLDADLDGRPLGAWALAAAEAAGLRGAIVVSEDVPAFARASGWPLITNPAAGCGIGTSVACAARAAAAAGAPALVILLADMPFVTAAHLCAVAQAGAAGAPVATAQTDRRPGIPAIVPARLYASLAALNADRGAGSILAADPALRLLTAADDVCLDIDTPVMLAQARTRLAGGD